MGNKAKACVYGHKLQSWYQENVLHPCFALKRPLTQTEQAGDLSLINVQELISSKTEKWAKSPCGTFFDGYFANGRGSE